jgi:hypothetical protein
LTTKQHFRETKDGLETEMNAPKTSERKTSEQQQQQQASQGQTKLNERYGRIGISAVAGAVQHKKDEPRPVARFTAHDSD